MNRVKNYISDFYERICETFCWKSVKEGVLSTGFWFVVWSFGFWVSIYFGTNGSNLDTTFRLVTLALIVGHIPKFVAIFLNTDTDFQGFMRLKPKEFQLARGVIGLAPLIYVVCKLFNGTYPHIDNTYNAFNLLQIVDSVWQHWEICLALVFAQAAFSWPKPGEDYGDSRKFDMKSYLSDNDTRYR